MFQFNFRLYSSVHDIDIKMRGNAKNNKNKHKIIFTNEKMLFNRKLNEIKYL